ncbi:MAG TPA: hypothetical protein VFB79_13480 [Candidatus Angelobacter sp.]|nr:hypothetical protein [Candidatus Angelobacter sp.]
MAGKNIALKPLAEPKAVPSTRQDANSITTLPLFEEHPTPVAIGAEAPPFASVELSASGPFGAY